MGPFAPRSGVVVADLTCRHLYIHVPFCARRCSYCDFAIVVRREVPALAFAQEIATEFTLRSVAESALHLDTVYLGGGTPSRLGADGVQTLLDTVRAHGTIQVGAEVTLEANPEDISAETVRGWRNAGVTRLSIGVQSFDDRVLTWMHRVHDGAAAARAVRVARDGGFDDFSLDLIFAVPDALQRDWARDVDAMLALEPSHLSLYGLTVEPHTPLGRWHARGEVLESPEERYEHEFLDAHARLTAAGFEHYEVSNFARPGRRARHNSAYWRAVPYLGVGPSAHGFDGHERRWNASAYTAWQRALRSGADPIGGAEQLSSENLVAEAVYLGLRTVDGLAVSEAERAYVATWREAGWVEYDLSNGGSRIRCTAEGWLRLDSLAADLTALRSRS